MKLATFDRELSCDTLGARTMKYSPRAESAHPGAVCRASPHTWPPIVGVSTGFLDGASFATEHRSEVVPETTVQLEWRQMRTLRPRSATGFAALAAALLAAFYGSLPNFEQRSIVAAEPQTPKSDSGEKKKVDEKSSRPLQSFMRAKLTASTKILEGLALEDLDLVREGAVEMNKMSTAEQWRRHDDVLYRQFSAEFRQTTSDLVDAAKEGLLDRAALKWMDATMSCIECHRYVRNKLIANKK